MSSELYKSMAGRLAGSVHLAVVLGRVRPCASSLVDPPTLCFPSPTGLPLLPPFLQSRTLHSFPRLLSPVPARSCDRARLRLLPLRRSSCPPWPRRRRPLPPLAVRRPVPAEEEDEPDQPDLSVAPAPVPLQLCQTCKAKPVAGDDIGSHRAPFNGRVYCSLECAAPDLAELLKSATPSVQRAFHLSAAASASASGSLLHPSTSSYSAHRDASIAAAQGVAGALGIEDFSRIGSPAEGMGHPEPEYQRQ